jgi:RHS repeat-associated protein
MDGAQRVALIETRTTGTDAAPRKLARYQYGNHLGSSTLELDDQARVISYEEYYPYGTTAYQASRSQTETPKRFRYTGKERDEESGLSYHSARYYAPWLGRWTSCDPAGLIDGTNSFAYARGNPVGYVDPSGTQRVQPKSDRPADTTAQTGDKPSSWWDITKKGADLYVKAVSLPVWIGPATVVGIAGAANKALSDEGIHLEALPLGALEVEAVEAAQLAFGLKAASVVSRAAPAIKSVPADVATVSNATATATKLTAAPGVSAEAAAVSKAAPAIDGVVPAVARKAATGGRVGDSVGAARVNDPAFGGDAFTVSEAQAILKSIRRNTDRLASGKVVSNDAAVRDLVEAAQSARATGDRALASSARHNLHFEFSRELESRGLLTNRRLDTPGQLSEYRIPDFQLVDPSYSPARPIAVWDLKVSSVNEYSHWGSAQFTDIREAIGIRVKPLYYSLPPIR